MANLLFLPVFRHFCARKVTLFFVSRKQYPYFSVRKCKKGHPVFSLLFPDFHRPIQLDADKVILTGVCPGTPKEFRAEFVRSFIDAAFERMGYRLSKFYPPGGLAAARTRLIHCAQIRCLHGRRDLPSIPVSLSPLRHKTARKTLSPCDGPPSRSLGGLSCFSAHIKKREKA